MLRNAKTLLLSKRSHYDILGVSKTATAEEIRKAFNKKAQLYHPDRNTSPDAKEKFQELFEAYKVLRDDQDRKAYDIGSQEPDRSQQQQQYWSGARRSSFYEDTQRAREQQQQREQNYYYYDPRQMNRRVITINPLAPLLILIVLMQIARYREHQSILEELDSSVDTPPSVIKTRWRQSYVLAFMNPFTGQWEQIPDGYDPPPIRELMEATVPRQDWSMFERKLPHSLTVGYVPQGLSKQAKVLWSRDLHKVVKQ